MTVAPLEIGAVARELGVAPSTLRSWERRYRTVVPTRGENGQRLYDRDQVVLLRQILAQTRIGVRARAAHRAAETDGPFQTSALALAPTPNAPLAARQEIDRMLAAGSYGARFSFDARLVVSELVKNAVVHGAADETVHVELGLSSEWIELVVRNGGGRLTLRNLRSRRRDHGHGLDIVDALADAWSIDTGPRGTSVRVRLSVGDRHDV